MLHSLKPYVDINTLVVKVIDGIW